MISKCLNTDRFGFGWFIIDFPPVPVPSFPKAK